MDARPVVSIEYCTACNFRGRGVWLAQELLAGLEANIAGVTLVPGRGGVLIVRLDGEVIFSNKEEGRLPEPRELKDAIRSRLGLPAIPRHSN
jgi:selenoprotein W-related protein